MSEYIGGRSVRPCQGQDVWPRTFESCTWKSVARGKFCGARAESAAALVKVACDAAGIGAKCVPAVGKERSQ